MDMWCNFSIKARDGWCREFEVSKQFIVGVWISPQIRTLSMISDLTCQPSVCSLSINGLYSCILTSMESFGSPL